MTNQTLLGLFTVTWVTLKDKLKRDNNIWWNSWLLYQHLLLFISDVVRPKFWKEFKLNDWFKYKKKFQQKLRQDKTI